MAELQHVYVTAHGEHTSGHWVGEKAQIGVRLAITPVTAEPAKGTTFTLALNGDVDVDSGTYAGTNGTLNRTWTARLGILGSSDNADAAWQADLADDMWTFLNSVKAYMFVNFKWTHVKIAPILADGSYGAPAAIYQFTTPLAGTATGMLPPEVACAITFRAPVVGRRGRGRFYLPALSNSGTMADNYGILPSAAATALVSAAGTLVTNLENSPGTPDYEATFAVMSAGSSTAVRPSQVRVGNHLDAQRRRQHQVAEGYTSADL